MVSGIQKVPQIKDYLGDREILKFEKTAFLCSRKVPASVILKCYDWAIEQRDAGICVISGFHSQIERDVFHYLVKGKQPIIIAMARGIPLKLPSTLKKQIDDGRLLIVSPFKKNVTKVTVETATIRNKMMIEIADKIVIGYADQDGNLRKIVEKTRKNIDYLF
jgi:predicted Rossmann fold nucleotide-binding protein DprA/Smf involved in DNA uptake